MSRKTEAAIAELFKTSEGRYQIASTCNLALAGQGLEQVLPEIDCTLRETIAKIKDKFKSLSEEIEIISELLQGSDFDKLPLKPILKLLKPDENLDLKKLRSRGTKLLKILEKAKDERAFDWGSLDVQDVQDAIDAAR